MNKELEALQRLYEDAAVYGEYLYELDLLGDKSYLERIEKDFNLLKQALKRNEPMKVIYTRFTNPKTENFWVEPTCPKCKSLVIDGDKFCSNCGQKLDWSDEK